MGKSTKGKIQVTEYSMSIHMGIALQLDTLEAIIIGEKVAWEGSVSTAGAILINKPELFGGIKKEGGAVGHAYFLPGDAAQEMPAELAGRMGVAGDNCPGFRGFSSVFFFGGAPAGGWTPITGGGSGGSIGGDSSGVGTGGTNQTLWRSPGGRGLVNLV